MLKRLWRWLKKLFSKKQIPQPIRETKVEPPKQRTDGEYESLFLQLLGGVDGGWSRGDVKGFLAAKRINEADLVAWLRGFGERLLTSTAENQELGRRLVGLRDLGVGELGDVGFEIGRRLWERGETNRRGAEDAEEDEYTTDEAEAWFYRGNDKFGAGDFLGAIASYDKALEFKSDIHEAWYNRGMALYYLEQYEEAIASYDKAIKIKPDYPEAWHNRGVTLGKLGRYEEAIASFDKALEFKPDSHEAWYSRGVTLGKLGRYEEAIASFDKALEFKPDDHEVWNGRGVVLCDNLGRYEEAIASFDKALEFKPDDHEAWHNRGVALGKLGQNEEAIASYDKAIKIEPDDHEAWFNRGAALDNLGRYEEAIASYDKALEFKPDYHQAWLNRGSAAGKSVSCSPLLSVLSSIARKNPQLNQRGYDGKLASYEEGLNYCFPETHPEGWGLLQREIGNAHYFQGLTHSHPRTYWHKAVKNYNEALKTLTATDFPELHLEVLRDLIRVQLDLRETAKAEELQRLGTDLLRRLLDECKSPEKKKQLSFKFAIFHQFTVDLAVQSGQIVQALELAEQGKNACLSWFLDSWSDASPKLIDIQQLLNPTTAIIYWHLSPYALHTFILTHNTQPIILQTPLSPAQRLQNFEAWTKTWNQEYSNYRKGENPQVENPQTWRDNLPGMLQKLGKILDISAIVNTIKDQSPHLTEERSIKNLILIPHRDLHRCPLHGLFPDEFTITYLPSTKIAITPNKLNQNVEAIHQLPLLSVEHPDSTGYQPLDFAQFESEAIARMFPQNTRKRSEKATKAAVMEALPQNNVFHFTGHGKHNFYHPASSNLALAGADKLTVADICNLDLTNYQLVSLAACETAITANNTITTEYVGFVSGFMGAGVRHVVSTLWIVESAPSALVMIQFYQLLQPGKSKIVALAEATQWLRNVTTGDLVKWYETEIAKLPENEVLMCRFLSRHLENLKKTSQLTHKPYNHPYFWAAFTITGNFPLCNQ